MADGLHSKEDMRISFHEIQTLMHDVLNEPERELYAHLLPAWSAQPLPPGAHQHLSAEMLELLAHDPTQMSRDLAPYPVLGAGRAQLIARSLSAAPWYPSLATPMPWHGQLVAALTAPPPVAFPAFSCACAPGGGAWAAAPRRAEVAVPARASVVRRRSASSHVPQASEVRWELRALDTARSVLSVVPPGREPFVGAVRLARPFLREAQPQQDFFWFKTWRIPDVHVTLRAALPSGAQLRLLAITVAGSPPTFTPVPLRGQTSVSCAASADGQLEVVFRSVMFESTTYKCAGLLFHLAVEVELLPGGQLAAGTHWSDAGKCAHASVGAQPSTHAQPELRECWLSEGVRVLSKRKRTNLLDGCDDGEPPVLLAPPASDAQPCALAPQLANAVDAPVRERESLEPQHAPEARARRVRGKLLWLKSRPPRFIADYACLPGLHNVTLTVLEATGERLAAAAAEPTGEEAVALYARWVSGSAELLLAPGTIAQLVGTPLLSAQSVWAPDALAAVVDGVAELSAQIALITTARRTRGCARAESSLAAAAPAARGAAGERNAPGDATATHADAHADADADADADANAGVQPLPTDPRLAYDCGVLRLRPDLVRRAADGGERGPSEAHTVIYYCTLGRRLSVHLRLLAKAPVGGEQQEDEMHGSAADAGDDRAAAGTRGSAGGGWRADSVRAERQAAFQRMCDHSLDCFKHFDERGFVVYVSLASVRLFGLEPFELIGAPSCAERQRCDRDVARRAPRVDGPLRPPAAAHARVRLQRVLHTPRMRPPTRCACLAPRSPPRAAPAGTAIVTRRRVHAPAGLRVSSQKVPIRFQQPARCAHKAPRQ